jgi:hypothetical protein
VLTSLGTVRHSVGLAAVCLSALGVAACGADGSGPRDAATRVASPPAAPVTTAPARLKQVTSACKLLPAAVVVKLLGGTAATKLTAKEDPVEHLADGKVRYTCVYGNNGREPFGLTVSTRPNQADTAAAAINAIANASKAKNTRVDVLGSGGVGYVTDGGIRLLAVAVPYETDLRMMVFSAPQIVPHAKLVEVAKHVVAQL